MMHVIKAFFRNNPDATTRLKNASVGCEDNGMIAINLGDDNDPCHFQLFLTREQASVIAQALCKALG